MSSQSSNESSKFDSLKAGQTITITIDAEPRNESATKTIARLMRRDPDNSRGLRRGQLLRSRRNHRYIRGNRDWVAREKAAKIVRVTKGESWTMPFTFDLKSDLESVGQYLSVKAG